MKIDFLKFHPEFLKEINNLCFDEWSYLFPDSTKEDWMTGLQERMNDDKLPLTLVAFESGNFLGTASLFVSDMEDRLCIGN